MKTISILLSLLFLNLMTFLSAQQPELVTVSLASQEGKPLPATEVPAVKKTLEEWRAQLSPEQFRILRQEGTERPFCGTLLDNKKHGIYLCAGCRLPLFASEAKFNSGTGWPSYYKPFAPENIRELSDGKLGMARVEIRCKRCDGHLGHVFPDGPKPTGLRYCLNSESLEFEEFPAK